MNIEVRTFINFKSYLPPDAKDGKAVLSIKDGSTFSDLLNVLGIPIEEPRIVVLNGVSQGTAPDVNTRVLNEGDIVALFPPLGGG
jgi:molybdopterin converting factor small subunit